VAAGDYGWSSAKVKLEIVVDDKTRDGIDAICDTVQTGEGDERSRLPGRGCSQGRTKEERVHCGLVRLFPSLYYVFRSLSVADSTYVRFLSNYLKISLYWN